MTAEAERQTADLTRIYDEIDTILQTTLAVDDFVDLPALQTPATHPSFDAGHLATRTPEPRERPLPPEPQFQAPQGPTGAARFFSGRNRYEQEFQAAQQSFTAVHEQWHHAVTVTIPAENQRARDTHSARESKRLSQIDQLRKKYDQECQDREQAALDRNKAINRLIRGLAYGEEDAVDEYIGIVLANSVYPESFPVNHEFSFDAELQELSLTVTVPTPGELPTTKMVKYVAASDELRTTDLSQAAQRSRYNSAVYAVALRTVHEVFEADRQSLIGSVSLQVDASAEDPITRRRSSVPLVLVASSRNQFLSLDLAAVEPLAALQSLNSAVSKNPFKLSPAAHGGTAVRR